MYIDKEDRNVQKGRRENGEQNFRSVSLGGEKRQRGCGIGPRKSRAVDKPIQLLWSFWGRFSTPLHFCIAKYEKACKECSEEDRKLRYLT